MNTILGGREIIPACAKWIREGEIVGFPTETVYGLGANALDEEAVKKIYFAKGRPSDNPLIVHVPDVENARKVAYVSPLAEKLFSVFSPGPITLVLPKKECVPDIVTAGLDTVGVRIPSHPVAREFLQECNLPIAAPSANLSKRVSPTTADAVYEDLNGKIPAVIDGGACSVGIESTVLSLEGEPVILRPGGITEEMLRPYLPTVYIHHGEVKKAASPGMKYTHYAPIVPCVLYKSVRGATDMLYRWKEEGKNPVVLTKRRNVPFWEEKGYPYMDLGESGEAYAAHIFRYLRICEKIYSAILVEYPDGEGIEVSVLDRVIRSSNNTVV